MGSINIYDKIMTENQKKYGNQRIFLHISASKRWFTSGILELTGCNVELMPKGTLTSFTVCDAYRYFAGQASLLTSKSKSRREYLMTTDNIIMLDHFFNAT